MRMTDNAQNPPVDPSIPVALVTGASRGLGAAMALELAQTHHIVAVARTAGALEELDDRIQAIGGSSTIAPMDITDDGAMQHLCLQLFQRWGHVDTWVHTAIHGAPIGPAAHMATKDFDKSIAINVTAFQRLVTYVEPLLLAADHGQALVFADRNIATKDFAAYGASKAAQITLAQNWQAETHKLGPKVHILEPNAMPTGTRARFHPGEPREGLSSPTDEAKRLLAQIA